MKNKVENGTVKFLLVDDEPIFIRTITDIIEQSELNAEILQAFSGEEALLIAKVESPDIILTDWDMPKMDGIELIKYLNKESQTCEIPVIMVTGSMTTAENLKLAMDSGAVDFIRKPLDKIEVIARINSMLLLTQYYKDKIAAEQNVQKLLVENLERSKRQLVTSSMHLVNKNNLLINIKERLEKLNCNESHEREALNKYIEQSLNIDNDWEQFKQHFELVHQQFFQKLMDICPDLTPYEKKMCAYYRINLSTNEIACILNITAASAKKSRHRLRQKLNLTADQDILQFLESI